jgi:creatinine amidohydrolase
MTMEYPWDSGGSGLILRKLAWPAIQEAALKTAVVLVPIGSIEQHGPHLPIDLDTTTAETIALQAAKAASRTLGRPAALIAPTIPFGGPGIGMIEWPGTINLRPQVFLEMYKDVATCLCRAGFQYVLALAGCYGNLPALTLACQMLKVEHPESEFLLLDGLWAEGETIARVRESPVGGTGHACEVETSVALVIDPDHVLMDRAVDETPRHPSPDVSFDFSRRSSAAWPMPFGKMTRSGVMGAPTLGKAEKGEAILQAAVERVARLIVHLQGMRQAAA